MSNTNFKLVEYFNENDANTIINEAVEKLMNCITDEANAKINVLKVQNIELQECIKKQSEELKKYMKRECDLKERERNINNLEKNFATKKLKDITSDITEIIYGITYKTIKQSKCNLCDENRIITLKDANNNEYKVKCKCNKSVTVWYPIKKNLMKLCIKKHRYEKDIDMKFYYFLEDDSEDNDTYAFYYTHKTDKPLEKLPDNLSELDNIPYNDLVFTTKELAQECCDYFNRNIDKEVLNQFELESNKGEQ